MGKPRLHHIPVAERLLSNARALRRAQTDAERKLWRLLRDREFADLKFRRQYPIGRFIADFCCFEHQLIIELDGGQHADQNESDEARTRLLEGDGYRVLRFWNEQILNEPDAVLEQIYAALQKSS